MFHQMVVVLLALAQASSVYAEHKFAYLNPMLVQYRINHGVGDSENRGAHSAGEAENRGHSAGEAENRGTGGHSTGEAENRGTGGHSTGEAENRGTGTDTDTIGEYIGEGSFLTLFVSENGDSGVFAREAHSTGDTENRVQNHGTPQEENRPHAPSPEENRVIADWLETPIPGPKNGDLCLRKPKQVCQAKKGRFNCIKDACLQKGRLIGGLDELNCLRLQKCTYLHLEHTSPCEVEGMEHLCHSSLDSLDCTDFDLDSLTPSIGCRGTDCLCAAGGGINCILRADYVHDDWSEECQYTGTQRHLRGGSE